ncbi:MULTISPECIES: imidazolonepropionase [Acetobacter]|jgi:imidazolonepropionase|uniref:Imidazolonepropionase n=2 Tax=Acetobacter TaxID=434 RepID=A0A841QD33_9PROT|nr:imidazolonepropionase [Acetobacter lovaniensis]MBB6456326.1 imidazolonepropionase [Acetobacter lovaniensis]MCI1698022.1 imidazolonepropionase [Acetobacter lovaniensis]MCP1239151.1 imidazolonepropionase [Acetobacter lovaniensis]NHN80697.1 imidazolonepropionase [Acetobacter lovaniensis]GBQ73536.1 imidazolonepropionase [Acetobacter lovaniensis NRIC 0474]
MWDTLWTDVHLATMAPSHITPTDPYGCIKNGAIAASDGKIVWVGAAIDLPDLPQNLARQVHHMAHQWATPGLVDAHTHLVYAGDRSNEFARRLEGTSYQQIAREGGGINATVSATRAASEEALLELAIKRAKRMLAGGTTTIEIKSGYGLTLHDELKLLRVGRALEKHLPVRVHTTFLGAHALPPEYTGRQDAYVSALVEEMLPRIAEEKLADSVDAFCESIAFSPHEVERIFEAATKLNLPVRIHADQMSDSNSCALAARFMALSADHVEYANEGGIKAMAAAGTVAMLLPGAFYFIRETKLPPIDLFRIHKVPMGLATDCNPGTSPVLDMTTVLNMACTLMRLTPAEALHGATTVGAQALNMQKDIGLLQESYSADITFWPVSGPHELSYWIGGVTPTARVFKGQMD